MSHKLLILVCSWILCAGCTASLESFDDSDNSVGSNSGSNGNQGGGGLGQDEEIVLNRGLSCDSLSFCSNYKIKFENIELPSNLGGSIPDGVYRSVEGTNVFYGLIFENGRFSYLWPDLTVTHGDVVVDEDEIALTSHTFCSRNNSANPSAGLEETSFFAYAVEGDRLYLRGSCGPPNGCPGATVFEKVASMCESLGGYDCPDGGCTCAQFVEESVPTSVSLNEGCTL